jgi:hypothetical protein
MMVSVKTGDFTAAGASAKAPYSRAAYRRIIMSWLALPDADHVVALTAPA